MTNLKDEDLLLRLTNTEDSYVERKPFGDSSDWLSTSVAFANSAPVGFPAVLFIGVRDDGTPQGGDDNLEKIQKSYGKTLSKAYPPIYYDSRVLRKNGTEFLAIVIPGSPDRPHFSGPSYVRVGPETQKASEAQFMELIAQRNSKAREILQWKDKNVTIRATKDRTVIGGLSLNSGGKEEFTVENCNPFYVAIARGGRKDSIPLKRVEIAFDDQAQRLRLDVS